MSYLNENIDPCEVDFQVYLTPLARKIFLTDSGLTELRLKISSFSAGDRDVNYNIQVLPTRIPDVTGDDEECLSRIAKCVVYGSSIPRDKFASLPLNLIYCPEKDCENIYVRCGYIDADYIL